MQNLWTKINENMQMENLESLTPNESNMYDISYRFYIKLIEFRIQKLLLAIQASLNVLFIGAIREIF